MTTVERRYWSDCISEAAADCGLAMTEQQRDALSKAVEGAHEQYGMAFYSPPPSDLRNDMERKWTAKFTKQQDEMERLAVNAQNAIKRAMGFNAEEHITIGEDGEVFRINGRTERVL